MDMPETALLAALKSWPASSTWDPLCATATHCPLLAQNHSWLSTVGRSGQGTELSGTAGMGGTKSQKTLRKYTGPCNTRGSTHAPPIPGHAGTWPVVLDEPWGSRVTADVTQSDTAPACSASSAPSPSRHTGLWSEPQLYVPGHVPQGGGQAGLE